MHCSLKQYGLSVGGAEGLALGSSVGLVVGKLVGDIDGMSEGASLGSIVQVLYKPKVDEEGRGETNKYESFDIMRIGLHQ